MSTQQQVLIVTGGSRGIGAAIVRAAAGEGYATCFSYLRDDAAAARLVEELGSSGSRALAIRGDVADPDTVGRLFDEAQNALGPVTLS